ncbi:MAG TPA: hypothetical protein VHB45_02020 [Alloacidobacterium sp.]|nr:hypothetical protein [Alloacidobacterium sp.]
MPPYANLQQFLGLVRQANPTYERHRSSSLHNIVAGLQQPNPNKAAIQVLIQGLPQAKRQKYAQALNFLSQDYLNTAPPGGVAVMPNVPVAPAPRGGVAVMPRVPVAPPPLQQVTLQQRAPAGAAPSIVGGVIHDANGPFHGWTEVDNLNRVAGSPNRPQTSAFTQLQITHVTQILRSVQRSIDLSLRTLRATPVLPGNGLPATPMIDMRTRIFIEFFGPCTQARLRTVTDNFAEMERQLFGARGRNATGLAVLNESATNANMAETYRRSIFRPASGHILLIVGSGFFQTAIGNAFQANDNTIGTLVHEFAHACFDASDIPVAAQLQAGRRLDATGMPPRGVPTCVVGEQDRQLVAWIFRRPWVGTGVAPTPATLQQRTECEDYPLRNADAYGQYALNQMVDDLQAQARQGVSRLT